MALITGLAQRLEEAALSKAPEASARLFGALPPAALSAIQRARFRETLARAALSPFYRDAFASRGIDVRTITHPAQLGDFYTVGEDLRRLDSSAFVVGRPDTA